MTESLTRQGRKQWKAELDCHGVIRAEWAEKFATGAICISWDRYATCLDEFDRSDLWSSELRLIWDAAYALAEVGTPVNAVTIAEQMTSDGTLDVLPGGVHYLLELLDQIEDAHDPFHFEEWLRIIARQASLRRFMDGAHDILKAAETYRDLESMRSALGQLLEQVPDQSHRREMLLRDAVRAEVDKIEAGYPEALFATIPEIDKLTSGFAEAELVVLAARPGHGKTMVALQMVDLASQDGFAGLIVSEEMSIASLAKRTIPRIASIDKSQWKQGIHQVRYEMRQHFENSAPLVVREFCVTIDRVERAIASAVSRYGIRFCVVDYAQLIKADGRSKYEQTSEVSVRMKRAANRHGITIFLLAQLGRSIDTRDGFVPIMSDLKDTGQLEQDADVILAGIWPKKFDDSYADPHEYRIYQLKNRNRGVFQHVVRMHVDPIRQRLREEFEVHFDRF